MHKFFLQFLNFKAKNVICDLLNIDIDKFSFLRNLSNDFFKPDTVKLLNFDGEYLEIADKSIHLSI